MACLTLALLPEQEKTNNEPGDGVPAIAGVVAHEARKRTLFLWQTYTAALEASSQGLQHFSDAQVAAIESMVHQAQLRQQIAAEQAQLDAGREQIAEQHQSRLSAIALQGAGQRAQINARHAEALYKAGLQLAQAQADALRQHNKRLATIRQQYLDDVERANLSFGDSLEQAEQQRNVNLYLDAVKQRERDLEDARKKRDRANQEEGVNYQERLRQAQQAYNQQVQAARRARQQQLAELQRRLAQERTLERQRHQQRLAETRQALAALLAEYARFYGALARMQHSRPAPRGRGGGSAPIPMQRGFEGVVRGPKTFYVEPGVTEYVYASGNLRGRPRASQPVGATGGAKAANLPASLAVSVGGSVTVDMAGFDEAVVRRWQPLLVQAAVDEVTAVITRAAAQQTRRPVQ